MRTIFNFHNLIYLSIIFFSQIFHINAQEKSIYPLKFDSSSELKEFFKYKNDGTIIMSGHRGGRMTGFPENCIEGFENVISKHSAIFEIDPRLTKDSVIVLMHDATLDRTTTGSGKVCDFTLNELKQLRLKDYNGNITDYRIPTLEEAIVWSKGKTLINLDKKDVPMNMIVDIIRKHNAEKHVILTVHTGAQARYYYDRFPDIIMSAFARNLKEYHDICISGVPWENMIAYVGTSINEKNEWIVNELHKNGVRCMISLAPTWDKLESAEDRAEKYKMEIATNPDIIESDIPTEVWNVYINSNSPNNLKK